MSFEYTALVMVKLDYPERKPVWSRPTKVSFAAESDDPNEAWHEFMQGSTIDQVNFPDGVDPFDSNVRSEQWEFVWIEGDHGAREGASPGVPAEYRESSPRGAPPVRTSGLKGESKSGGHRSPGKGSRAKKPIAKKPGMKKPAAKKPIAKRPGKKKPAAKKPIAKRPGKKKPAAKRPGKK